MKKIGLLCLSVQLGFGAGSENLPQPNQTIQNELHKSYVDPMNPCPMPVYPDRPSIRQTTQIDSRIACGGLPQNAHGIICPIPKRLYRFTLDEGKTEFSVLVLGEERPKVGNFLIYFNSLDVAQHYGIPGIRSIGVMVGDTIQCLPPRMESKMNELYYLFLKSR